MVERFSEHELALRYLGSPAGTGVLVDVGAHIGRVSDRFADNGWRCVAFEPDPENFASLEQTLDRHEGSLALQKAVSDERRDTVTFYRSAEYWGIHSLAPYHDSHTDPIEVEVTRLDDELARLGIDAVDVLKIDVEGADLPALRSFPFDRMSPRLVVAEFSDERTVPHFGYDHHDTVAYMAGHGYRAFISEWAPIVQHSRKEGGGGPFDFLRCCPYPVVHTPAWGNLLFVPEDTAVAFDEAITRYLNELAAETRIELNGIPGLRKTVEARDARIAELQSAIAQRDARIRELDAAVAQRDTRIQRLTSS